jgi:hypothetical protein
MKSDGDAFSSGLAGLSVSKLKLKLEPGSTTGGSIIVLLTSCFTGMDWSVPQIKTKNVSCQNCGLQTSQTGGQGYSNAFPLVFPD